MSMRGIIDGFPVAGQKAVLEYLRDGALTTPGLAIATAGSATAKASAFSYRIGGKLYAAAAQSTIAMTEVGALGASASAAAFLAIDTSGTVTVTGVSADTNGELLVPAPAGGTCWFGAVEIVTGAAGAFTGGTTALDDTSLTVTYHNLSGVVPGEAL